MKEPTQAISSLDQEIVVITLTTLIRLYELNADAANLYVFYCKNAKIQSNQMGYTNKIKADDVFCRKGLKWGQDKFYRTKKLLQQEGFIEDVVRRNLDGTIIAHFVQINFLLNPYKDTDPSYKPQYSKPESGQNQPPIHNTQNQSMANPEYGFQITNADNKNRNAEEEKKKTPHSLNSLSRGKKPIEHISYSNIIGHNQPNTIGNTPTSLSPLSFDKLYEVAQKKNVPLATVERLHETILNHIENGNKYKTKSVLLTLYTWINNGLSRGDIQTMSEEERMIFDMRSPSRLKKREALIKRMKEKELL